MELCDYSLTLTDPTVTLGYAQTFFDKPISLEIIDINDAPRPVTSNTPGRYARTGISQAHDPTCDNYMDCDSWRGGIALWTNTGHSTSDMFTLNVWGVSSGGTPVLTTTGHAGVGGISFYHHGTYVGYQQRNSFEDASYWQSSILSVNSDSAKINVVSNHDDDLTPGIYKSYLQNEYSLTWIMNVNNFAIGQTICKIGMGGPRSTDFAGILECGLVKHTDSAQSEQHDGRTYMLWHQIKLQNTNLVWAGDSGALLYGLYSSGLGFAGIASLAASPSVLYFATPDRVKSDLNIDHWCTSYDC